MSKKKIAFLNLAKQSELLQESILEGFKTAIDASAFVSGERVRDFEDAYAHFIGVKHCVAVDNGTNALFLALVALGIGRGDEVLVPVNTFIATAEAVSLAGARPVFIDIEKNSYCLDTNLIEKSLTSKTKAIIPVHLYGQCADMDVVRALAQARNFYVIEDACQAHGAQYQGQMAGAMGDMAAFSFYPGKNLGAWGEAGAIVTNNDSLAEKLRLLRNHGSPEKYVHKTAGGNFRMSEFQAIVLKKKLGYLPQWNNLRQKKSDIYRQRLGALPQIKLPAVGTKNNHVWHLFVIQADNRDGLRQWLFTKGIETGIHYPTPLHLTGAYDYLGYKKGDFSEAEKVQAQILSLPMYPEIPDEDIHCVCDAIKEFYGT